jgi:predicted phosphate transport protein (TIGR00153 family)
LSKKILNWLDKRKRVTTIQLIRRHLELTTATFEELSKAVKLKIVEDEKLAQSNIKLVANYEKEADSLRRQLSIEVAKSELPPSERGDLLRLVRVIDWIADWSLEAARILSSTPIHKLSSELIDVIVNMVEKVKECIHAVVRCVDRLSDDLELSLQIADQVEQIEEEVDELYQEARSHYPTLNFTKLNSGEIILISQFIDAIEYVADWCENTIDQIRVIAISLS